jgi:hypothetical protein
MSAQITDSSSHALLLAYLEFSAYNTGRTQVYLQVLYPVLELARRVTVKGN